MHYQKKINLDDIRYVKLVPVGSADPNRPLSEAGKQAQVDLLNQCLSGNPKGIIIGKQGAMIKKVGLQAREELESILGEKIFLELFVRVEKYWRNRKSKLQQLGYIQVENER